MVFYPEKNHCYKEGSLAVFVSVIDIDETKIVYTFNTKGLILTSCGTREVSSTNNVNLQGLSRT